VPFFRPQRHDALGAEKRRNYRRAQKLVDVKGDRYGPADLRYERLSRAYELHQRSISISNALWHILRS
jgi:hypothetical protein